MRSILLHVHDDNCMEARLQVALDIAREFCAHVTCLQPVAFDFVMPGDLYGTMIAELLPALQERADEQRDRMCARLASEDVSWDWRQEEGPDGPLLMRCEGLADLVLIGAHGPSNRGRGASPLAGHAAVHGRTPLLVVPEAVRSLDIAGTAVVGWNGSLEAAHALRSAVPLLGKASSVTLVQVAEPADHPDVSLSAVDAAEYLSRHGIASEIVEVRPGDETVGQALAKSAAARRAAYLVIGAYGHARTLETVFGGVTRELLSEPPIPIFMAH